MTNEQRQAIYDHRISVERHNILLDEVQRKAAIRDQTVLTRAKKIKSLMDGFGYTRKEAIAMLDDMGE